MRAGVNRLQTRLQNYLLQNFVLKDMFTPLLWEAQ